MDVGLVTRDVGVIDNRRIRYDSVNHRSHWKVELRRPLHRRWRLGWCHRPVFAEVQPFGQADSVVDGFRELLRHCRDRLSRRMDLDFLLRRSWKVDSFGCDEESRMKKIVVGRDKERRRVALTKVHVLVHELPSGNFNG